MFYIPLYTCFYVLGGVLSGVNLFGDADDMGLVSILIFSAGLLLSLGGTACLARRSEVNSGRITPRLQRFLSWFVQGNDQCLTVFERSGYVWHHTTN